MSESSNPKQPQTVESTISFDVHTDMVTITPRKVNGIAIVSPVSSVIMIDTLLEVAAACIIGRKQKREVERKGTGLIKT